MREPRCVFFRQPYAFLNAPASCCLSSSRSPKPQIGTKRQHDDVEDEAPGGASPQQAEGEGEGQAEQKKAKLTKAEQASKGARPSESDAGT